MAEEEKKQPEEEKEPIEEKQEEKEDNLLDEIRDGTYKVGTVGEEEEVDDEEDEEFEEGRLLTDQKHEAPKDVDKFIDTAKGELVEKEKLTEWDVIKAVAKQNNVQLRNPNSGCKHCYGRGWIGKDSVTKAPIPCTCINIPKSPAEKMAEAQYDNKKNMPKMNRKSLKQLKRLIKSEKKKMRKQQMEEEQRLKKMEG